MRPQTAEQLHMDAQEHPAEAEGHQNQTRKEDKGVDRPESQWGKTGNLSHSPTGSFVPSIDVPGVRQTTPPTLPHSTTTIIDNECYYPIPQIA